MNTELRKKMQKMTWKFFFQLMNNGNFKKIMGNMRKHEEIKLVTTEARRNYLVA